MVARGEGLDFPTLRCGFREGAQQGRAPHCCKIFLCTVLATKKMFFAFQVSHNASCIGNSRARALTSKSPRQKVAMKVRRGRERKEDFRGQGGERDPGKGGREREKVCVYPAIT